MNVEIVSLTIIQYLDKVRGLSQQYQGDETMWPQLSPEMISDEDDRDEFAFIKMALWDRIMHEEFYNSPPTKYEWPVTCDTVEPGSNFPGSLLLRNCFGRLRLCEPRFSGAQ